jgi:microcystin-dependent protein
MKLSTAIFAVLILFISLELCLSSDLPQSGIEPIVADVAVVSQSCSGNAATATLAAQATTAASGATMFNAVFPAGQYVEFASTIAPAGYNVLYCNGASVSTTTYSALYAVIGFKYGNPGSGNMKIPDRRGLVARGFDDGRGIDPDTAFRVFGSTQSFATQKHFHQSYFRDLGYVATTNLGSQLDAAGYSDPLTITPGPTTKAREAITDAAGGTFMGATETRMANITVCYFIKY